MTPKDLSQAIERMQGMPDRVIAEATGEPVWKVRRERRAAGLKGNPGDRSHWTRRDWLMAGACGLEDALYDCA